MMVMLNSVRDNAWNQIKQGWITIALVTMVVLSWLQVVGTADWLRDANVLVSAAICGVLYGWLLASSRFRGRTALIIALVTSLGLALLVTGRILPEVKLLTAQPFEKAIWLMNARIFTLLEALRDDAQWLLTNYFPNTRLFLFVNVFAMWNAAVWLVWCVAQRKRALRGVLPIAVLIAYYTGLGKNGPSLPLWFIAGSVLLLARTAFTYTTHDWDRRHVGFPDLIGEDWTVAAATLSVAVIVLAGASTPEWRTSMQRFIESLRPPPRRPHNRLRRSSLTYSKPARMWSVLCPAWATWAIRFLIQPKRCSTLRPAMRRPAWKVMAGRNHPHSSTIGGARSTIGIQVPVGSRLTSVCQYRRLTPSISFRLVAMR